MHLILTPLTATQEKLFWNNYKPGVPVFHLPGINLSVQIHEISQELPTGDDVIRDDVVWFYNSILNLSETSSKFRVLAYSDIISMYVLRYLFAAKSLVDCHLLNTKDRIYVYSAKGGDQGLPVMGFSTSENPRGSRLVLGAYISGALSQIFANKGIVFVERSARPLSYRWIRMSVLLVAEIAFGINFIIKLIRASFFYDEVAKSNCCCGKKKHVFLVRVPHHARFLDNIVSAWPVDQEVNVLVLPQARQGSIVKLLESLGAIKQRKNVYFVKLNMLSVTKLVLRSSKEMLVEMFIAKRKKDESYTISYGCHLIKLDAVVRETSLFLTDYMYINALKYGLHEYGDKDKYVSFSMKGRYSCMESKVARTKGVKTIGVQTAALDDFPSAIFPWFDIFYANSSNEVSMQRNIGVSSLGEIVFSGAPQHVREPKKISVVRRISYFTQPYDHAATESFLVDLLALCKEHNILLTIKFHPRDAIGFYPSLVNDDSLVISQREVGEVIGDSDIVLARTSSVLFESAMSGVLTFACMLSNIDMEFKVDYLGAFRSAELTVASPAELQKRLGELPHNYVSFDKARAAMGINEGVEELVPSIQML